MADRDPTEFRPTKEPAYLRVIVAVGVVVLAAVAYWWYRSPPLTPVEPPPVAATAQQESVPAQAPEAAATGPQHPVEELAPAEAALPALGESDARVQSALTELLGRNSVVSFLRLDGFVRRVVATVDNLPREQAAARMWPVQPTPQRFTVESRGEVAQIGVDNSARYTPFVRFVDSVNSAKAVDVYAQLYPLFQQAYEELGYPGKYFNDRLVAVIDNLLQAPEPVPPVQVKLTEVKGSVPSTQPWVRYEFVDPALEALPAGQKMLVRMGLDNERRLKAKLADFRHRLATAPVARK